MVGSIAPLSPLEGTFSLVRMTPLLCRVGSETEALEESKLGASVITYDHVACH